MDGPTRGLAQGLEAMAPLTRDTSGSAKPA